MTLSAEYISILQQLLINGYNGQPIYVYSSYSYQTVTFNLPTSIVFVAKQGSVIQATTPATVASIVENGGRLSITYIGTFTSSFEADEIDMYAVVGNTFQYKIASVTGSFSSQSGNNLSVEWTIDVVVNDVFNVSLPVSPQPYVFSLPSSGCSSVSGMVIIYPYLVHLLIAYTLIPNLPFTVQSQFPNIPLAVMSATVPVTTSATDFKGVTLAMFMCGSQPVLCFPVSNGLGTAIVTSSPSCSVSNLIGFYQIGNVYLTYMQIPISLTLSIGSTYTYKFGITIQ